MVHTAKTPPWGPASSKNDAGYACWIRHSQHLVISGPTGLASHSWPAPWATRHAGKGSRPSTGGRRGYSLNSRPRAAKAGCRGC